jgi:glutamine synthetase
MEKRTPGDVLKLAKDAGVEIVDVRFCDLPGLMQHFSVPAHELTEDVFEDGLGFDGSSIRGFQEIQESDMLLIPDPNTAVLDPFRQHTTLNINAYVRDPLTGESYSRDPRYIVAKAEAYLKSTGLADTAYFGPEAEFYIFDSVRFDQNQFSGYYFLDSVEGVWNSGRERELDGSPNLAYKPRYKEGYFPVPPMDQFQDLRSEMVRQLEAVGISIEVQHHEVGTAGQAEIDMRFDELAVMADKLMLYKYVVKNVARAAGYSVTFMPKPLFQDNGSGMHVHQSLWKDGEPLFFDEKGYAGLSDMARWYIGGLLKHAPAICAFSNQFVQAVGARLRGAGEPRVLAAQPFGVGPNPVVLEEPEGQAARVPLPRPVVQPVSRVLGDAHGRPRRDPEPNRAAGTGRP